MLINYFKVAWRNLVKQKLYAFLNIFGLALGISAALMISLYIHDELSYDAFHRHANRIVRVGLNGKIAGQQIRIPITPPPLAFTATQEFPEVVNAARIANRGDEVISYGNRKFTEKNGYYADSTFFEIFDFALVQGDAATALDEPNTVVLAESVASKYFGNEDPMGKMLTLQGRDNPFRVTGIMEDIPEQTHMDFDILFSMASYGQSRSDVWLNNHLFTYLLLRNPSELAPVNRKLTGLIEKYVGPDINQMMGMTLEKFRKAGNEYGYFLQPITDIHLYSDLQEDIKPAGDIRYVYILGIIALFIIMIACINFMNLSTARSANRAREVGVRKSLGSSRNLLINQFMSESLLMSLLATLLALGIAWLAVSPFNNLAGKTVNWQLLFSPLFLGVTVCLMLLVGLIAGSYPAFFLSAFKPAQVLKGNLRAGFKSSGIRNGLVVFQFAVSIGLIICTAVVYNQIQYTSNKNLGFQRNNVLVINNTSRLGGKKQRILKQKLDEYTVFSSVGISNSVPPGVNSVTVFRIEGTEEDRMLSQQNVDQDFIPTLGIEMIAGRNFSDAYASDSTACIINEAAVREFGFNDPLNEKIITYTGNQKTILHVVGVMKDFNYESLKNEIRPMIFNFNKMGNRIVARVAEGKVKDAVSIAEKEWDAVDSGQPFNYEFVDESFDALFRSEQRLGKVFTVFTMLAILVACLGLLGLASFTAEQKTKEIGIRKALGATVGNVMMLLSKDFTRLVIIAFVIAVPVSFYIMDNWLNNFAYHVEIGFGVFVFSGLISLVIAWLTVSYQSFMAARSNPVRSLRSE